MLRTSAIITAAAILVSGCSITENVTRRSGEIPRNGKICVEENQRVTEPEILNSITNAIIRNGFRAATYKEVPTQCEFRITYIAHRKWDFKPFLSQANVTLWNNQEVIGNIEYKLPGGIFGGGGINLAKFDSTEEKIGPLLDKLLSNK